MEVFSYVELTEKQLLIFCEKNEVKLQAVRLQKEQEREIIVAYIEGHKGHYLCPSKLSAKQKILLENGFDIDFPDETKALARIEVIFEGNLLFIWKIIWERDSTFAEW